MNAPVNLKMLRDSLMAPAAEEIVTGVWVGNQLATVDFPGSIVCVTERRPNTEPEKSFLFPLLTPRLGVPRLIEFERSALTDWEATVPHLDSIAAAIEALRTDTVLVHCTAGIERSPLAVAWYLFRYQYMSFDEAYALVFKQRTIALDRRAWLSREARAIAIPSNAYEDSDG